MCVRARTHTCRGQRWVLGILPLAPHFITVVVVAILWEAPEPWHTWWSQSSPSAFPWAPGREVESPGLCGQHFYLLSHLTGLPSHFLRQGLSLTLELATLARLAGQRAPGSSYLHPPALVLGVILPRPALSFSSSYFHTIYFVHVLYPPQFLPDPPTFLPSQLHVLCVCLSLKTKQGK